MTTAPDWPELDPWGGIVAGGTHGGYLRVLLPTSLEQWLRAAGGGQGASAVVRLALARYLAAEFPELRPVVPL